MPNRFSPYFSRGTAVMERSTAKRIVLCVLAAVVLLGVLIALLSSPGAEEVPETQPSPAAEPAAESGEASPAPLPATERVPPDVSGEIAAKNVQRRDGFPMLSWAPDNFSADSRGRLTYAGARTLTGIDVSEHQGSIDWSKVAADGVDFAMIRLGYRGSTQGQLYLDDYFERNITGANAAGVPVGVYFYSQAIDPREAEEEARYVLEHLKDHRVDFPVVFDWEIVGGSSARTYSVSRRTLCRCARAFCDAVKAQGYQPMIYFTRYLGYRKYILRDLTDYGFWYAEYGERPRFAFDFDMWQYSETGQVSGIDGDVDLNIWFVR